MDIAITSQFINFKTLICQTTGVFTNSYTLKENINYQLNYFIITECLLNVFNKVKLALESYVRLSNPMRHMNKTEFTL